MQMHLGQVFIMEENTMYPDQTALLRGFTQFTYVPSKGR